MVAGYLDYLRSMYGKEIYVPTTNELAHAFQEYMTNAQSRLKSGKLIPGEEVRLTEDNRVQVSGQVAVMQINGLVAKIIFERNTARRFFVEESSPLDWMYPYLSPHGLIMELQHEPVTILRNEVLSKEQARWMKFTQELIGNWLTETTSVYQVCEFAEKIHLQSNLEGFEGNQAFVKNQEAQMAFSKLRSALGGLYAWRAANTKDEDERDRMQKEAGIAFRQAFALCPYSPEALFRYVDLLLKQNHREEAIRLAQTTRRLKPDDPNFQNLLRGLER